MSSIEPKRTFSSSRSTGALVAAVGCALLVASTAHAEPLRGTFEFTGGPHAMILAARACELNGDMESCQDVTPFAGFQFDGSAQVGPWFALGLRAAGSIELGTGSSAITTRNGLGSVQRQLLLWQLALRARFDPTSWPRGLWLGAEVGVALAVSGVNEVDVDDHTLASVTSTTPALLLAAVVGYDIALGGNYVLGFDLRGQYLSLTSLPGLRVHFGARELAPLPYIALGAHAGVRW